MTKIEDVSDDREDTVVTMLLKFKLIFLIFAYQLH